MFNSKSADVVVVLQTYVSRLTAFLVILHCSEVHGRGIEKGKHIN